MQGGQMCTCEEKCVHGGASIAAAAANDTYNKCFVACSQSQAAVTAIAGQFVSALHAQKTQNPESPAQWFTTSLVRDDRQ